MGVDRTRLRHSGCFSLEALGLVVRDQCVDGRLQSTFHNFRELVVGQAYAVVGETVLGEIIVRIFSLRSPLPNLLLALFWPTLPAGRSISTS